MTTDGKKYHGTYKGVVVSNVDVTGGNRVMVRVEDVLGNDPCIWATAHTAVPGMNVVPMINSGVWIEFQDGDVDRAVWTGFWRGGIGEAPPIAQTIPPGVPQIVMGTPLQNYLLITDAPGPTGGIQIQIRGPAGPYIKMSEAGIELSCGPGLASIRLVGTAVVINNGSFTVPM
ncbi:phage baseplate assembly protein V [Amycolatopsis anabasis]|uniref:phage baseplate assembly protein V n=1 Tax=Amycolatopsis anabasis TaxID=1840409 RepID=UPI00131B0D5B|nr:phage baseplate assembly protein V [Amycolatopsis anabasis]